MEQYREVKTNGNPKTQASEVQYPRNNTKEFLVLPKTQTAQRVSMFVLLALAAAFLGTPLFFDMYRGAAFETVPIDGYVNYLLYLTGSEEGTLPGKPFVFRIFSVAVALPLVDVFPLYKFSNLDPGMSDVRLAAILAFSLMSYLAAVATAAIMYLITRIQFNSSRAVAAIVFLVSLLLVRHTSIYGVDPISIMMLSAALLSYRQPWMFALLLFVSIGFNEKILFIFFMLTWGRLLFSFGRNVEKFHLIGTTTALLIYIAIYSLWPTPPMEELTTLAMYPQAMKEAFLRDMTLKGTVQNVLPFLFLLSIATLACLERKTSRHQSFFQCTDIMVLLGLFVITHLLSPVMYNAGRIMMYSYPLFLPMATIFVFNRVRDTD
jgi:hypothetical protein